MLPPMSDPFVRGLRVLVAGLLAATVVAAAPAAARAAEPPLTAAPARLAAALECPRGLAAARRAPVLLVHGTGSGARESWVDPVDVVGVLRRAGHVACTVDLPANALGDVQASAEYVVAAVRAMTRRSRVPIAMYGHSQGGLLVRWALTHWPSLRRRVADAVTIAATHHGTTWGTAQAFVDALCVPAAGCPPAFWQQRIGSRLLAALNRPGDETPGPTAWTTVRTSGDGIVQPQGPPRPTSALRGATNLLVQRVCPGRTTSHSAARVDSVSLAALVDAARHRGPARPARLPRGVCATAFAPGVDATAVQAGEQSGLSRIADRALAFRPQATAEPPVRRYALRRRAPAR